MMFVDSSSFARRIERVKTRTQSYSSQESFGSWMFVSSTVQSARILRPSSIPFLDASRSSARLIVSIVSDLTRLMFLFNVDMSGVFPTKPKRQNLR
jgi:hypothetical protein